MLTINLMRKGSTNVKAELKEHFSLKELPFELTPDLKYFCNFENYQNVLDAVNSCIDKGDAIIKITGEVGTGKTLLCRKLVTEFDGYGYQTLYVHNPSLSTDTLLRVIADELNIEHADHGSEYEVHKLLNKKLLEYYQQNKRVVLLIDESQTLTDQSLEAVRLLTNLESEEAKLIQIILFGQPELDQRLSQPHLRQLQQRITFSYQLSSLQSNEMEGYISKRLVCAGHQTGRLFSAKANKLIHKASNGIPRVMNILAYKSLLASYARGFMVVDEESVKSAIKDSKDLLATTTVFKKLNKKRAIKIVGIVSIAVIAIASIVLIGLGLIALIKNM